MRLVLAISVAIAGCWADFPASRFAKDQKTPSPEQRDGSPPAPELGPDQRVDRPLSLEAAPREAAIVDLPPVGDLPRDQKVADQPRPDQPMPIDVGISCSPGAFLTCANSSKDLRKCNATGNGITVVVCGSSNKCDPFLKRCTQCDPADLPTCQGTSVASCSVDGLDLLTPCSLGCQGGKCCTDGDKDGVASCAVPPDCNDNNGDVFPGQQKFFAVPIPGSNSFDYNCSGLPEREFPQSVQCVFATGNCSGEGWPTMTPFPPGCGQSGNWVICVKGTGPWCETVPATPPTKTQRCH